MLIKNTKLPYVKSPCDSCPFLKNKPLIGLPAERLEEILNTNHFTCHKTSSPNLKQCGGFMIIKGDDSLFVRIAKMMDLKLDLKNKNLIFDNKEQCLEAYKNG